MMHWRAWGVDCLRGGLLAAWLLSAWVVWTGTAWAQQSQALSITHPEELFVDPLRGDDRAGNGSKGSPFRTIFRALSIRSGWEGYEYGTLPFWSRGAGLCPLDGDGDGDQDLLIMTDPPQYLRNEGRIGAPLFLKAGEVLHSALVSTNIHSIRAIDYDGDGDDDLIVMIAMAFWQPQPMMLLLNVGPPALPQFVSGPAILGSGGPIDYEPPAAPAFGDITGDGLWDIVIPHRQPPGVRPQELWVYPNCGTSTSPVFTSYYLLPPPNNFPNYGGLSSEFLVEDLDRDGDNDLLVSLEGRLFALENLGGGAWADLVPFDGWRRNPSGFPRGFTTFRRVFFMDHDGDGVRDLIGQNVNFFEDGNTYYWYSVDPVRRFAFRSMQPFVMNNPAATGTPDLVVHLAPGSYDAARGEVFPLFLHGTTVLEGAGTGVTNLLPRGQEGVFLGYHSGLRDLTISGAKTGFRGWLLEPEAFLDGVIFRGCERGGVLTPNSTLRGMRIEHCRFEGCAEEGLNILYNGKVWPPSQYSFVLNDCDFVRNRIGLYLEYPMIPTFERCRFIGNSNTGLLLGTYELYPRATLSASLFAHNGIAIGLRPHPWGYRGPSALNLWQCTLAENALGIALDQGAAQDITTIDVRNCILWNRLGDIGPGLPNVSFHHCDLGQSGFAGTNGNVSILPDFVDPANEDFHLAPGSSLLDLGDSAVLAHVDRDIDGTPLPVGAAPDIGADEVLPIDLVFSNRAHLARTWRGALLGPSSMVGWMILGVEETSLYLPPAGTLRIDLSASSTVFLGPYASDPRGVATWSIPIPPDPLIAQQRFLAQGLIFAASGGLPSAWNLTPVRATRLW